MGVQPTGGKLPASIAFTLVDGATTNNAFGYVVIRADQYYAIVSASGACDVGSQSVIKVIVARISGGSAAPDAKTYVTAANISPAAFTALFGAIKEAYIQDLTDPNQMALIGPTVALNTDYDDPSSWRQVNEGDLILIAAWNTNTSGSSTRYAQVQVVGIPKAVS